jgi:serine/threonine-protein kinase
MQSTPVERDTGSLGQLGKYELLQILGSGASSTVYLAEDTILSRRVALKVFEQRHSDRSQERERFLLEARSVTQLNHPRIVGVFDINEVAGRPYIAMEWMKGGSAQQALTERGAIE